MPGENSVCLNKWMKMHCNRRRKTGIHLESRMEKAWVSGIVCGTLAAFDADSVVYTVFGSDF